MTNANTPASTKVFAIPEVLDQILIFLAEPSTAGQDGRPLRQVMSFEHETYSNERTGVKESSTDDRDDYQHNHIHELRDGSRAEYRSCTEYTKLPQPWAYLAAVERVNCLFRDTVQESQKIQRLLEPPAGWYAVKSTFTAIRWLLKAVCDLEDPDMDLDGRYMYVAIPKLDTSDANLRNTFRTFKERNKKASWKKIKLCEDGKLEVELDIHMVIFSRKECGQTESYTSYYTLEEDITLDRIWRYLNTVMMRPQAKHEQKKCD